MVLGDLFELIMGYGLGKALEQTWVAFRASLKGQGFLIG